MPPDIPNEQELMLKKRARRRLVGAIALVLLMVIILPRILQDRATLMPQEAIKITMPDVNSNHKVEVVSSSTTPVDPKVDSPITDDSIKAEPPIPSVESKESKSETNSIISKSEKKPEETKPLSSKSDKVSEESKAPQNNSGSFAIQIGVYSDMDNVKNLQNKLKQAGLTSRTEKISTPKGEKIRLKAGSFSSRQDAVSTLSKLQDDGLTGMVVSN